MNEEIAIEIKDLCKNYKMFTRKRDRLIETIIPMVNRHIEFNAIKDLNLTIQKGESIGILGKNGAGKSTLLKMITGVVTPSSGEINVTGKISSLLELGAAFNPELTGEENIYQHGQVMGLTMKEIENKKQDIIDFADIGEHIFQPVKTYSSGMFARLAFACAINVNPDILIVDEVLSVGDMAFQLKCFKKFEDFKKQGKTLLFVTHNVADVIRNCNRAIILSSGTKIFDGDVKTGVDKYKKIIVGLDDEKIEKNPIELKKVKTNNSIKDNFQLNPEMLTYGNGDAEIIDYGLLNLNGEYQTIINNQDEYIVKIRVKFNKDIDEPIFAMSIKDFKGLELGGVNTKVYKKKTGKYKAGEIVTIEFKQTFPFLPEKYAFSFGCTKYNNNGDLEVFDRKYDAFLVEIISYRDCLGLIDLKSDINIIRSK
ncbi:MAG: ABC transporter ATP-binding protein [Clostridia bacterium]|nr:ABC transporter ATP-binding protein [Clostridia bacterium]MBR3255737.1 ABC transporter ATP-binding protein [Clostridia bacterium]